MISKSDLCVDMAAESIALYRIARVLGISQRQVIRYLMTAEQERTPKPRKPKPNRNKFAVDIEVYPNLFTEVISD